MRYQLFLISVLCLVLWPVAYGASSDDEMRGMDAASRKSAPTETQRSETLLRLHHSAERGNVDAQYQLGMYYTETKDYAKALKWFRKASEQGSVKAQYRVGLAYSLGRGVPQDQSEAEDWFAKAGSR